MRVVKMILGAMLVAVALTGIGFLVLVKIDEKSHSDTSRSGGPIREGDALIGGPESQADPEAQSILFLSSGIGISGIFLFRSGWKKKAGRR